MTQNNDMNAADMYASMAACADKYRVTATAQAHELFALRASLASAQAAARHLIETGDTLRAQRDALLADRYALAIELTACANRLDWHSEELTAFPLDVACSKRARALLERIGSGSAALEGTK